MMRFSDFTYRIVIPVMLVLLVFSKNVAAQTDTEFWFVVPEVTINHQYPGGQPASFRFATGLLAATVTISMPANQFDPILNPTGFPDIVFNMAANSFRVEDVTCWIMTPCSPAGATSVDINRMENKPLNASGINKFGIRITATNPVTVYYEISRTNNKEIWALKGKNALGIDFYTPFQTHGDNQNVIADTPSAIDVVATQDNTVVTFQLPAGISASYGNPMTTVPAGGTLNRTLMTGQTFSLFPLNKQRTVATRLRGTRVTATKPIGITLKDDSFVHTSGGCYDIAGDQLVPTNIIGKEYAIIRSDLNNHDHIYILGTQNATTVTIYNTAGAVIATPTVNAGEQLYYQIPTTQTFYRVKTDKPVYVWHVGGFGCEQGGAVLPPIDICTGTTQVAFARTSTETFYVIMMVRKGAETGFTFNGVVRNDLFPPGSFVSYAGFNWSVARFGPFTTAQIPAGVSNFMNNSMDIFHLGIVNGGGGSGCYYGYFSDYNELKIQAVVAGTSSTMLKTCYGNPVQLYAFGGTTYLWSPDSTLNNPNIQLPWASPKINTKYKVVVSGACNMKDSAYIDVLVSTPLTATFITDKVSGCAPLTVNFEDKSTGIKYWRYDMGDTTAYRKWDNDGFTPDLPPPSPFTFSHTFNNNTADTIRYKVVLLAKNADGCALVYEKIITVLPSIDANFTRNPIQGCNPLAVTFTNASTNNTADSYLWEFGDGLNQVTNNPTGTLTHTYNNPVPRDSLYTARMIATSPHGCRDTATATVNVYSYFTADFTVSVASGCSPLSVFIDNISVGDTARYVWKLNGVQFKTTGKDTTIILNNLTSTFIDYQIQLEVFNQGNRCSKTLTKTVRVYPQLQAGFLIPQPAYCNLSSIGLTNTTTPLTTNPGAVANVYSWDFGDGANSAQVNPTHIYDNQTNNFKDYTITLTARNQFGCQSVVTRSVRIYSQIYADFAVIPSQGCSPLDAFIDNNSRGGIVTYNWDYGDATNGVTDLDHNHLYINNGLIPITRTINLTVTNEGNCTATLSRNINIYPSVTATFTPSVTAGCNELSVNFTNSSKANATVFNWNFGDGNSSVADSTSHTFVNPTGKDTIYAVTLNVQTEYGCTSSTSTNITVYPFIDANFAIDTSFGCSPLNIWFNYTKHPGITEYRWDWDGGGSIDQTMLPALPNKFLHQYVNQTGALQNLTPRLTVVNHAGCSKSKHFSIAVFPEITTTFNPSVIAGCNPLTVNLTNNSFFTGTALPLTNTTYFWDFGDGGSSNTTSPSHIYTNTDPNNNITYSTRLLAVSQYGCSDSIRHNIEVYNRVESHFTFEYASNCTPFDVTFNPAALGASVYNWSYGGAPGLPNESFPNGNPFTRTFTNIDPDIAATYTVTLSVENDEGCPSVQSRDIEVYPVVDALFTPSTNIGCSDLSVLFSNTSTGGNLQYLWNFGNGQSATTATKLDVSQIFTNRGSIDSVYNVKLKTINPNGCRDSLTIPITVHPKVEAGFVFAQQSQCTPFYLDLSNTSLNGSKFFWDFGYSSLDTIVNNKNTFAYIFDNFTPNSILTYQIKLISLDSITGCKDSIQKPVTVYPRVVSEFDVDRIIGCNPLVVKFTNNSSGLGTYLWEFGDGGTSVATTPADHTYSHPYNDQNQTYTVKLSTTNSYGCKSFADTLITVYPLVKSDFQWNKFEGCTPLTINLNNSSTSPLYKYSWDFGDASPKTYVEQPGSHVYTNATNSPPVVLNPVITLRTSYVNDTVCVDSLKLPVKVFPHIYPDFTTNFEGCHPHNVVFNNQTVSFNTTTDTYFWDLGSGVNSLAVNPTTTYYNVSKTLDSTFSVRLRSVSEHGCVDSVRKSIIVHPRPFAAMELTSEYISCPPFDVEIDNNSLGTNLTYHYDFGDGADSITTNSGNMIHTFDNLTATTQPYQIDLKATSAFGCDDSVSQTIYVYPHVFANYVADPGYQGCSPLAVKFNNTSINSRFYKWEYDDGITSSFSNPSHSFLNFNETDKVFNVRLRAWSEFNCIDADTQQITVWATPIADISAEPPLKVFPDATFNIYNQSSPGAAGWNYSWDFNDNTFSTLRDPGTHTYLRWGPKDNEYKYNIKLKVESPHCKDSTVSTIFLLPATPEASFVGNIDSACSPLEVHFINTSLWADSYLWEFGDGTTSTDREPIHTFNNPGYYNVKLTVTGDGGNRFFYRVFRVYQNPNAAFSVYPQRVMLPDATVHAYNLSTDYTRNIWDFGDGITSNERDPVHTYSRLGEFKVSLWVYMDYGNDVCVDSISKNPAVWVEGIGVIKFPNAFKPNRSGPNGGVYDAIDYKNEVFHPYHQGVVEYKLMVFSRWGEQLFTSNDVNIGWDGYVGNNLADQGVYMWRAIGKFTNGKTFDMKGSITLLR